MPIGGFRKLSLAFLFLSFAILGETSSAYVSARAEYKWYYFFKKTLTSSSKILSDQIAPDSEKVGSQDFFISPQDAATPSASFDKSKIIEWTLGYDKLRELFQHIRDDRFMDIGNHFLRRPSWLYPDDGCFARAEVSSLRIRQMNLPSPTKIFAFGDLQVVSHNAIHGSVSWWYHVVAAYRLKDNNGDRVIVFDPAINPQEPMTLDSWMTAMSSKNITLAACSTWAIDTDSNCSSKNQTLKEEESLNLENEFLNLEWERLLDLNRIPELELGNEPPWL